MHEIEADLSFHGVHGPYGWACLYYKDEHALPSLWEITPDP